MRLWLTAHAGENTAHRIFLGNSWEIFKSPLPGVILGRHLSHLLWIIHGRVTKKAHDGYYHCRSYIGECINWSDWRGYPKDCYFVQLQFQLNCIKQLTWHACFVVLVDNQQQEKSSQSHVNISKQEWSDPGNSSRLVFCQSFFLFTYLCMSTSSTNNKLKRKLMKCCFHCISHLHK